MSNATAIRTTRPTTAPLRTPRFGQLANERHDGTRGHIRRPVENLAVARADRTPRRIASLTTLRANLRAVIARGDRAAATLLTALIARTTPRTAVTA